MHPSLKAEEATEKHFQYTFYLILRLLGGSGCTILTEKTQAVGRVDAVLEFKDYVYIFEFKLDGSASEALRQIEESHYAEPYLDDPRKVFCIGVDFSSETMTVKEWKEVFSGMLIVRQMPDNEIRILGSTYFGLSLFDFSLHCDTFIVNSCIEPMRKKKMLKILETDFKNLFLKSEKARIKKKSSTFEQRTSGKGFGKTVFTLSGFVNGQAEKVQIKHPLIRLRIQLDKLNINNP